MFAVAFLAATLFPAQSEAVLVALVAEGEHSLWGLLGSLSHRFLHSRWFPISEARLRKAETWYHTYGRWSLLLSWVPFIGDPLTFAAGVLREPFVSFFALTLTAKLCRYLVLVGAYLALF